MAPVGLVDALGWLSSPEVGIASLVVFFILSVTLLALCVRCHRNTANAYDVNMGTTSKGAKAPKGTSGKKTGAAAPDPGVATDSSWRNYKNMPPSTLDREKNMRS
ncbi:uncharacterized protein AB9W97_003213 isoform 1-T2 [Spinachia spinachia]